MASTSGLHTAAFLLLFVVYATYEGPKLCKSRDLHWIGMTCRQIA